MKPAPVVHGTAHQQPEPMGRETVSVGADPPVPEAESEHFKPTGTIFLLVVFVATMLLLWGSVYVILLARGVTQ